ncbi:MAG: magnesium transporter [Pirellulaceae bacterium]|nr:magnesium transporter [Pirellulaceae bacterium]
MINLLYLPELREMLAEADTKGLHEFCTALHPARTAEFMEGLTATEAWQVLQHADPETREEIFSYFDPDKQLEILETQDRTEMAGLVAELASDDRVDLLHEADEGLVAELLPLLSPEDRRDILRLKSYPEGVAGAVMTSDIARLDENLLVREALNELARQAEELETVYYVYVVDDTDHLRGVVSTRQLLSAISKPETRLRDLMETDLATVNVMDDQEEVARKVAKFDLLAIPVVDDEFRLLGIITHDDVIDVMREEATEDAHLSAGVQPLDESYLKTPIVTLSRKRGMWLTILFVTALFTAFALRHYEEDTQKVAWLVIFIPLVISAGGNSGTQAATLVITALTRGDVKLNDWVRVVRRELAMGLLLGGFLASLGFVAAMLLHRELISAAVVASTLVLVVLAGTIVGSMLPMVFRRLGLDPALMSNPFVTGIIDIMGIVIYMNVAIALLTLTGKMPATPVP